MERPVVVIVDEFNIAIQTALQSTDGKVVMEGATCIANNFSTLHCWLDRVARMKGVILLLSVNKTLSEMRELCPSTIRAGRVNLCEDLHAVVKMVKQD